MKNKETITVKIPSVIKDVFEKDMSVIPNCCGAYVIKVESGMLYVGSSKTLRNRISQHKYKLDPNIPPSDKIVSTCYYETETLAEARIMENWLIREINPQLNKTNNNDCLENECGAKCSKNCKTWNTPAKNIMFDVHIIEACKNIPEERLSELPKKPGVYVITVKSGKKYVGSSTNVCSRVKEHQSSIEGNVNERIKSANCYITKTRTDAYIFEYFKINELKPELNREFRDDAWTWETVELKKHFNKTTTEQVILFKKLSKCIGSCIPEIEEVGRKDRVTYRLKNKHVFFIKFMSGYLQVDLKDEDCKIKSSTEFLESIKPTASDKFHKRLKIYKISEIDEAMDILTQAYNGVLK
tara:strand:+ start:1367 stop:2431 length:1065 start_codon:yes stop_codon:yes gene_type:complete